MPQTERPRLTVDLEPAQKEALKTLIPWGMQRLVVSKVIGLTIDFLKTNGLGKAIDGLMNGEVTLTFKT